MISAYCADSATDDRATWTTFMRHISGLVEPGRRVHHLRAAALPRLRGRGKRFPSADVDEHDIRAALQPQFEPASGSIEVCELDGHEAQGYSGIVLAWRRRRLAA